MEFKLLAVQQNLAMVAKYRFMLRVLHIFSGPLQTCIVSCDVFHTAHRVPTLRGYTIDGYLFSGYVCFTK